MGCFPLYPPLELFHSFGLTPVVLWGLNRDITSLAHSDRHLQPFACGVARCLSELILSRGGDFLDAIFMYNACDTLRNLPEILEGSMIRGGNPVPLFRIHIPAVPLDQPYASRYLKNRFQGLIRELEGFTGRQFDPRAFRRSSELYRRQRLLCRDLEEAVEDGRLGFADCAEILLSGSRMTVEDHITGLEHALVETDGRPPGEPGMRIMLSGILPPPRILLETMDRAGLRVAVNDFAALRRFYGYHPEEAGPAEYYEDFYRNHHPCTTFLPSADRRIETIRRTVREKKISGFVFVGEKFCEYEYFEFPFLEQMLRQEGVQTLYLEAGMDDAFNPDAYRTRIEAFAEVLGREKARCKEI